MDAQLKCVKVQAVVLNDDDLTIADVSVRQDRLERCDQFRKVTIERFLISTLNQDFVPIAEYQSSETIPLRLEEPSFSFRNGADTFREHRTNGRNHRKLHMLIVV